jgi:methionyl-tRNA formyltransferase
MDAGLDTGPIVAQWRVPIEAEETAPQLEERLAHVAADLLEETLPGWLAGDIEPHPQDHADARMTRPLRREDGRLDPTRIAAQLERQVRAYQPWPGSFIEPSAGRVVVWSAKVGAFPAEAEPGTLVRTPDGGIALGVVDGLLEFVNVQPAGGRRMSGAELLRGRPALAGSKVAVRADTGTGG